MLVSGLLRYARNDGGHTESHYSHKISRKVTIIKVFIAFSPYKTGSEGLNYKYHIEKTLKVTNTSHYKR